MVELSERLDVVFQALTSHARRSMLQQLADHPSTVGELAELIPMSMAAASKHVKVLERAGLVSQSVQGRRHVCSIEPAPLASARIWFDHYTRFWNERLDALAALAQDSRDQESQ